jgi:hypothetical protein
MEMSLIKVNEEWCGSDGREAIVAKSFLVEFRRVEFS